ncbi:beta-galactosidase [Gilliamella sp. B2969]|uniref:beta-galactosidase n=1 Tax=Gilliamella sp. B2969 TaxID=2818021 RepID=UPI00226AA383|nr:beta-galactosidase [Gilliamella sp. B2969]MCX8729352.1 beta-galactosidase [Gilliamella sp. B2969]
MKSVSTMFFISLIPFVAKAQETLIAPMLGGAAVCESAIKKGITNAYDAQSYCKSINETPASLIEKKLSAFGPKKSSDGKFEIGYVLTLPLLSFVDMKENGEFTINKKNISYQLKTMKDSKLPVVIYLFSNHFSVSKGAETEDKIANLDRKNLMQLSNGNIPIDDYFASKTYPWAINASDSLIDKIRQASLKEILTQICNMDNSNKNKIRAMTVLGEVHFTFPNFFDGMGYKEKIQLTDYSPDSVKRFRNYLVEKYKKIENLNNKFGSQFESFEDINPPSKDITTDHLNNFFEHLNYESSGKLAIYGWAEGTSNRPAKIKIFVDGVDAGYADTGLNRMDVYQALPSLGTSAVGYRYYLDFRNMSHGIHSVDIVHENSDKLTLMKHLDISVMDRQQSTPKPVGKAVEFPIEEKIRFWNDYPESLIAVYYNPLSEEFFNFREKEVTKEISKYSDIVSSSCIGKDKVFSHQIAPVFNGDWNEEKIAAADSLKKNSHYNLGFNTYGSAFYGDYTFQWLKKSEIKKYGLPEAHPMLEDESVIKKAILRHHNNGAVFMVPYYVELAPNTFEKDQNHAKFEIKDDNKQYGSSQYFRAIRDVMNANY